ncbi:MAG: mitofilin family membrane protein [Rhodospirillaceae bacterium]
MASPPVSDRQGSEPNRLSPPVRQSEMTSEQLTLAKASERLIQRFGGIRPMANKLEVPVTTVQGWKKRGAIPAARLNDVCDAARRHGIALEEAELDAIRRFDDKQGDQGGSEPESEPDSESEPELVPLNESEPAPVNVPLDIPPVRPPVAESAPPFEFPLNFDTPTSTPAMAASSSVASAFSQPQPAPVPSAAVAAAAARLAAHPTPQTSRLVGRLMTPGAARLTVVGGLAALVVVGISLWSQPSPPSGDGTALAPVNEHRLGELESKVARVAHDQSALDAKLAGTLSSRSAAELAERIAVLERDIPDLRQKVAARGLGGTPALGILLSATQLRGALATSNPFVNELAALRLTAFNDTELKQLLDRIAAHATAGIASEAWLIGRFSTVQGNILRAAAIGNPGARIGDLFLDVLSDWMPPLYRMTGVPEGSTPRALADRTRAWMAAGDFSRAVEQLGELTGLPAEVAAPWLAEARARVTADHARARLTKYMMTLTQPETK